MSVTSPDAHAFVPAQPQANRIKAPGWRNPRLLIGLLLVFASIAVGARVVAAADSTVPVFAARRLLPTGTALTASELTVVRFRLTGSHAAYLDARDPIPGGRVLTRPVGAGEVIPVSALAMAGQLRLRPVPVPIDGPVPSGLQAGGLVDVWASAKAAGSGESGYLDAQRIATSVEVSGVESDSRSLAASTSVTIQVLLEPEALPSVLNALANEARVAVLPIPGAGQAAVSDRRRS